MATVDWRKYEGTRVFEDAVSTLVSRLHPDAERIDGSGGDGGRDVQIRRPGQLYLFELKSFTNRLSATNPNRRSQVEKSLLTAAALQPDSWTLIVPIDHNESELKWFDGLKEKYPFPLLWHGEGWLNDQMMKYPDVRRYYFEDSSHEVIEILKELNSEQGALAGGVDDALKRAQALRARLNDIDPQYRIEISPGPAAAAEAAFPGAIMYEERGGGGQDPWTISLLPKYKNADRDRPIQIKANLVFAAGDASGLSVDDYIQMMAFGSKDPMTVAVVDLAVDAPTGLGGSHPTGKMIIGAPVEKISLPVRVQISTPAGIPVASLDLTLSERVRGNKGVTLFGEHDSKFLTIKMKLDYSGNISFDFGTRPVDDYAPMELIPVLRLLIAMTEPNVAVLSLANQPTNPSVNLPQTPIVEPEFLRFVEAAGRVQYETGVHFRIPGDVSAADAATLSRMVHLLDGEALGLNPKEMKWEMDGQADVPAVGHVYPHLGIQLWHSEEWLGRDIPLGICHAIGGPWEVTEVTMDGSHAKVTMVPTSDTKLELRRGAISPLPMGPGQARVLMPST